MISKYEIIEFKKDEILTSPNFVENKIYFILEGILRLHLDDPDHNLTLDFRFPWDFISSFSSLIKRLPSNYTLQAVTSGKAFYTTYEEVQKVISSSLAASNISKGITEENYIAIENLFIKRQVLSASELYLDFVKDKKQYINQIPLHLIASYIGITPQSLSRIRKVLEK